MERNRALKIGRDILCHLRYYSTYQYLLPPRFQTHYGWVQSPSRTPVNGYRDGGTLSSPVLSTEHLATTARHMNASARRGQAGLFPSNTHHLIPVRTQTQARHAHQKRATPGPAEHLTASSAISCRPQARRARECERGVRHTGHVRAPRPPSREKKKALQNAYMNHGLLSPNENKGKT